MGVLHGRTPLQASLQFISKIRFEIVHRNFNQIYSKSILHGNQSQLKVTRKSKFIESTLREVGRHLRRRHLAALWSHIQDESESQILQTSKHRRLPRSSQQSVQLGDEVVSLHLPLSCRNLFLSYLDFLPPFSLNSRLSRGLLPRRHPVVRVREQLPERDQVEVLARVLLLEASDDGRERLALVHALLDQLPELLGHLGLVRLEAVAEALAPGVVEEVVGVLLAGPADVSDAAPHTVLVLDGDQAAVGLRVGGGVKAVRLLQESLQMPAEIVFPHKWKWGIYLIYGSAQAVRSYKIITSIDKSHQKNFKSKYISCIVQFDILQDALLTSKNFKIQQQNSNMVTK
ncbi:Hypothetical_protein [Hexamita inflata]|uniref:Hypothetical_protein n=1 Tax=Hexamita inflata TaxID=28002 RepID=A0ABP1JRW2_9EUKA